MSTWLADLLLTHQRVARSKLSHPRWVCIPAPVHLLARCEKANANEFLHRLQRQAKAARGRWPNVQPPTDRSRSEDAVHSEIQPHLAGMRGNWCPSDYS